MLQINKISKQYKTGDLVQKALNNVSLNFRDNEFVSILGPSGSGKTTLLNVIGGLDRYDKGDLIINNVSTKNYKDRDWDSYRNHTIGFVFQNYNLIPHQTVLANVELALTISGISKKERKKRAIDALKKVGLKNQIHKKPNQMSGGQMQRVAIARALVNNPSILLADEPTGALDTETSVQVMELLSEVAKDRLVIMVTHNPELATQYSTRIVNLKDGKIIDDSNPFNPKKEKLAPPKHQNLGKASMSLLTAFSLSLNNLLTKKARTILTSFAGSIGIIGIALILSLSTGFQNYIDKIQEDTLTSYPLTINKETADASSLLLSMVSEEGERNGTNTVKESQVIQNMLSKVGTNDLTSLKEHLEKNLDKVIETTSLVEYNYSVQPQIYTKNSENDIIRLNPSSLLAQINGGTTSMMGPSMNIFYEMIDSQETLMSQYDILAGRWAENYNEVILFLPEANSMSDLLVYSLGLRDMDELSDMISKIMREEKVEVTSDPLTFTYDELMNIPLKLVDASSTYKYNGKYNIYEDMTNDTTYMKKVYDESTDIKIVGIATAKESSTSITTSTGIGYTKELTRHIIDTASKSEIVKKQLKNKDINVFNNKSFTEKDKGPSLDFQDMISIDTKALSAAFGTNISESDITKMTEGYMGEISSSITTDTSAAELAFTSTLTTLTKNMLNDYITKNEKNGIATIKLSEVDKIINDYLKTPESISLLTSLERDYVIPASTFKDIYFKIISTSLKGYITATGLPPTNPTVPTKPGNDKNSQTPSFSKNNSSNNIVTVKPTGIIENNSKEDKSAVLVKSAVDNLVTALTNEEAIITMSKTMGHQMIEASMQKNILSKVGELTANLMKTMSSAFKVDESKFASAFKFNLGEDEVKRLIETMSGSSTTQNADTNLISLGYQDIDNPSSISIYFKDFDSKEEFIAFLDDYNNQMQESDEEKVIKYTDMTGFLMSSVKTIVDTVSYVLIAFVSISLIVSSIMIGIITYISVLERTKEIGILRAIGASKRNISSIFNAETFIVGLFAGLLGVIITLLLLIPINSIIKAVTDNVGVTAVLPFNASIILIILSVILTLIGGLIPSRQAAKKDPVTALRSE